MIYSPLAFSLPTAWMTFATVDRVSVANWEEVSLRLEALTSFRLLDATPLLRLVKTVEVR